MPQPRKKPQLPMEEMALKIAANIKEARKKRGLTQAELASLVGVTREAIAAYETGRVRLMDDIIINFASALKVSTDEILGVRSVPESPVSSLRLVKRLKKIENLPPNQQKVLLKNIDMFLKAAESDD